MTENPDGIVGHAHLTSPTTTTTTKRTVNER